MGSLRVVEAEVSVRLLWQEFDGDRLRYLRGREVNLGTELGSQPRAGVVEIASPRLPVIPLLAGVSPRSAAASVISSVIAGSDM